MADELAPVRRRPADRVVGAVREPSVEITLCSCCTGGAVVHPLASSSRDATCTECGRTREDIETDATYLLMYPGDSQ